MTFGEALKAAAENVHKRDRAPGRMSGKIAVVTGGARGIGRAIATLASGAMPYSTGHSFPIDGGMLMPRF